MTDESLKRMEEVFSRVGVVGRIRLEKLAGVSEQDARAFIHLQGKNPKNSAPKPPEPEHKIVTENKALKHQVKEQQDKIDELSKASELLVGVSSAILQPPEWLVVESCGKNYKAIATAVLADPHFDEVTNPAEIGGVNAYNRAIGQLRLRKFFHNIVRIDKEFMSGTKTEGLVLAMAGDIVSGNIHEELKETNAAAILDTCLFWSEEIAAGIEYLMKFYDNIFCPCVVGNHGRQTKKPRNKGKVRDNFDYLIYSLLARHFRGSDKVTFLIPDTPDCYYSIYSTKYCLTHGDQFRGGSGIAGALSPMLIGDARKRKKSNAINKPYDYMVIGHWHQDIDTCGIIACNSMKGYDEYANNNNFNFSEPTQAFWLTDSEKGRTLRAPIHVRSKAEDWSNVGESSIPLWLRSES